MADLLNIQLFGEFQVTQDQRPLTALNTGRLQSLLAYLLLHRDAPQSRQQLAFLFWPDSNDAQARTNLRNALHQLRNALPEAERFLQIDNHTVQWRGDGPFRCDLVDFTTALQEAQAAAATTPAARAAYERAIQFYRGDLLPDSYEDWVLPERERWRQVYAGALEQLVALLEAQREVRPAIEYARRLLQLDPLLEAAYCRLMQLHALLGDRATALRIYHTCTTTLMRELGVEPSPTTQAVYERLLNLEAQQNNVAPLRASAPLVGRDRAWEQLQRAWRRASAGQPGCLILAGEAGIGKTRLAEELLEWATRQGIAVANAHCYAAGGRLAYSPVQEWLRSPIVHRALPKLETVWQSEVARLLPELLNTLPNVPPPAPLAESWQRQRLFEALARLLLLAGQPLLLSLDDIQWCDEDTRDWLAYLLRFQAQARLLVLATLRSDEVAADHPVASFLRHLERTGHVEQIDLARLGPTETITLATNLLGHTLDAATAERIYGETEGNPLFVIETIRAGLGDGATGDGQRQTAQAGLKRNQSLPPKIQAIIETRLRQLSPQAHDMASIAAVIGRAFGVDVLAQISESNEDELVQSLDELWQLRIIREASNQAGGVEVYDFTHDKLREIAYNSLSPMRRRHLHRRVAQTLTTIHADNLDEVSAQIALHWEKGDQFSQAIRFYQRAASAAQQLAGFQDALVHLQQALKLAPQLRDATERAQQELTLQMALGALLLATQGYAAPMVEQAFTRAWALGQQVGDPRQHFQALWGLGRFYFVQPNVEKGLATCQKMLALAQETGEPDLLLEAYASIGTHLFHRAALQEARTYLDQSVALYDRNRDGNHGLIYGQDPCVVALAYGAWARWCLGELDQAVAQSQAALALAQQLDHPYSRVIALTYLAVQHHFMGDVTGCLAHAESASVLAARHGFTLWLAMATFLRGWVFTQQGEAEAGLNQMQESVERFRSTGAELGAAYFAGLLAETLGRSFGQPAFGLVALGEAFDLLERAQDRWCEAELHRLKGDLLLLLLNQPADAESLAPLVVTQDEVIVCFETARQIAHEQQALLWELRATVSLCRVWQRQGRTLDAYHLLNPLYLQFPKSDKPQTAYQDLVSAQSLLLLLTQDDRMRG